MKKFTELDAWKVGIELLKETYALSRKLPKEELFGLTSQLRRSVVSILANIAEGFGRYTYADKANKFTIARGECNETEALMYCITAIGFVREEDTQSALKLIDREEKLLSGLITSCRNRSKE
ncbi:MAG: four helix bundle protein [Candidatus Peribacteraceae bacterium]|nr:four helix bundle protein [Candidatus Peribacteraceae bacterium]